MGDMVNEEDILGDEGIVFNCLIKSFICIYD